MVHEQICSFSKGDKVGQLVKSHGEGGADGPQLASWFWPAKIREIHWGSDTILPS